MPGVELGVTVGSTKSTRVSSGKGVNVGLLDVGVSSIGAGMDEGFSVVWDVGRLQDDTPRTAAMTAIQKRFLILSSFSGRIVIVPLRYGNGVDDLCFAACLIKQPMFCIDLKLKSVHKSKQIRQHFVMTPVRRL